eukprot:scaffold65983_cov54-Phaeocystis_antarctica.AAC.1
MASSWSARQLFPPDANLSRTPSDDGPTVRPVSKLHELTCRRLQPGSSPSCASLLHKETWRCSSRSTCSISSLAAQSVRSVAGRSSTESGACGLAQMWRSTVWCSSWWRMMSSVTRRATGLQSELRGEYTRPYGDCHGHAARFDPVYRIGKGPGLRRKLQQLSGPHPGPRPSPRAP